MPGKHQPNAQHREGGVNAVTLPPQRAVEHDRRPEQHEEKAGQPPGRGADKAPRELHGRPREHHVEETAQQLDEVQIGDRRAGEQRQKEEVRYIIIPDRHSQRGETPVLAEKVHPDRQKVLIIQSFIRQAEPTQHERRRQQTGGDQHMLRRGQRAGQTQQQQRQCSLRNQQQYHPNVQVRGASHRILAIKKRQETPFLLPNRKFTKYCLTFCITEW